MATVKISGASDDLVDVEGDVPGCDEYGSYDTPLFVELSTGDVFRVEYTAAGVWKVTHHQVNPTTNVHVEPHGEGEDPEPYTDTVTVVATDKQLRWVEVWQNWPKSDDEVAEKVAAVFDALPAHAKVPLTREDYLSLWVVIAAAKRRKT